MVPTWHIEFPGQRSDRSHSCDLCCRCGNAGSLNPLCQARDEPAVLGLQARCPSLCAAAGRPALDLEWVVEVEKRRIFGSATSRPRFGHASCSAVQVVRLPHRPVFRSFLSSFPRFVSLLCVLGGFLRSLPAWHGVGSWIQAPGRGRGPLALEERRRC